MDKYNLVSLLGIFLLMGTAWIFSSNRRLINWRLIFCGTLLQLIFALFVFWMPAGVTFFRVINDIVIKLFSFSKEGMYFLFGPLAVSPGTTGPGGENSLGFILVFQALPTIIFFSTLMSLLYFIKFMPVIIRAFAWIFTRLLRVSGAESLCVSSNIFVGIESAFTIKPYLKDMTSSELTTILTAGMATIASTVLALYVFFLKSQFPSVAGHLISASILSAPAALIMAKLIMPEVDKPKTLGKTISLGESEATNWVESIIKGSFEGVKLCVGICALLMAFLSLLAMVNWGVSSLGSVFNLDITLESILSYIFYPFACMIGIPCSDVPQIANLLGKRLIVTELIAYQNLATLISKNILQHPRTVVIAAYALCGFAHIASLAIFVGGYAVIIPSRGKDLAKLGFKALLAATLACLMTGAVAGVFFSGGETILLGK
ncbi:MAG: nucleoside transporter C-terminal domain-containing protein [bacterium]|nr:nucleoside transporter C-terminal domain-containing protein [bacterium]